MDTVEVELDALPFAQVVELEGRAQDIARVEKRLNLDNAEISIKSYHEGSAAKSRKLVPVDA